MLFISPDPNKEQWLDNRNCAQIFVPETQNLEKILYKSQTSDIS